MYTIAIRANRKIVMFENLQVHQFRDQRREKQGDEDSSYGQAPIEEGPFRLMVF
jgi:hypothetical protein